MKMKRLLSLVLAAALTAALALPAGAAKSSFVDVVDEQTAVNADILRLMGVVSGTGGDSFNPDGTLTRAEFATMVVKFIQRGHEAPMYATRTIFADVTAKHWALPYINLAATHMIEEGEKKTPLMSGVGTGNFEPDHDISLAEAVTVLLHVLKYPSTKTGADWPASYMNLARSIGMLDGINGGYLQPITRRQAAQLFVNALRSNAEGGTPYVETLGEAAKNVIILAVGVTTDDGRSDGAIRTSANKDAESYLAAAGNVKPTALLGKRGTLVTNDKKEIVSFLPNESSAIKITLSGDAKPSYLTDTSGKKYVMSKDTVLYTADAKEGVDYQTGFSSLKPGSQITLYSEKGKITAVYSSSSMSSDSVDAVVVQGAPSMAMFRGLTNGVENVKVMKNDQQISVGDLKQWDVVTYDSLNNALVASDLRLNCVYQDASPNTSAPNTIKVGGGDGLPVLSSAWDTIKDFKLGERVTVLLTVDGKVAGMAKAGGSAQSNAVGIASKDGVEVFLPAGGTLSLKGAVSMAGGEPDNRLVNVGSLNADGISVYALTNGSGQRFDVKGMKLGSRTVAPNVRIYERVENGVEVAVSLRNLGVSDIPSNKIAGFHTNTSGVVDFIVLDQVTGDAYIYGKAKVEQDEGSTMRTVSVENGTSSILKAPSGVVIKDNAFVGAVKEQVNLSEEMEMIISVVELKAIQNVAPTAFFEEDGNQFVTVGGRTYSVSDRVECYKSDTDSWFSEDSGEARLAACKAFSSNLTIYIDPIGEKVRVVEAK